MKVLCFLSAAVLAALGTAMFLYPQFLTAFIVFGALYLVFLAAVALLEFFPQRSFPQSLQPIRTAVKNRLDYLDYSVRGAFKSAPLRAVLTVIVNFYSLANVVMLIDSVRSGTVGSIIFNVVGFVAPLIIDAILYVKNFNSRFTSLETVKDAYKDILPPEGWTRLDLIPDPNVSAAADPVYVNRDINVWLRGDKPVAAVHDKETERAVNAKIYNSDDWENLFAPFLKRNYLDSKHTGKQFYNENKFGISAEFDAGADSIPVHKTCYFASYLTNIIPGKKLVSNEKEETVADTEKIMPYSTFSDGTRQLNSVTETLTANEPGVTTLFLADHSIHLWKQNRMAQSSIDRIVASGSGSADWDDVKPYLGKENGFKKAVVCGMQRELWEESYGTRVVSLKKFMPSVETRITGYFRWLRKAGKSEFVGITRVKDGRRINSGFSPEFSEVIEGEILDAHSVASLLHALEGIKELRREGDIAEWDIGRYSVSCVMALMNLKSLCEEHCRERCGFYDKESGKCTAPEKCRSDPAKVLFPEGTAVSVE